MKPQRILVAGSGGQGVVFLGRLIATAAMSGTPHVTFFPSYGAEVRGGACHCQVILSPGEIPSPVAREFDVLLLMNQASVDRYLARLAPGGTAILNSTLCHPPPGTPHVTVPATERAEQLGDARTANLVLLGALLACHPILPPEQVEQSLRSLLTGAQPNVVELNLAAFRAGLSVEV